MSQQYVKLIAKPDTWFKAGTEVWCYDEPRRLTLEEFNVWDQSILVRGIRVCEFDSELEKIGEEYIDGESCLLDEFDLEIIDHDFDFSELEK